MIVSFNEMLVNTDSTSRVATYIQGYIGYKTRSFQNVPSEPQAKNFLFFIEKLCFVLEIFKFLYFNHSMIYQICDVMMSVST